MEALGSSEMELGSVGTVSFVIVRVMKTLLGSPGVEGEGRDIWRRVGHDECGIS